MASPFDAAWALPDEHLVAEMGEVIYFGTEATEITAVVSEVDAARAKAGGVVSAGFAFQVHLSRAQVEELTTQAPEKGALALQGLRVRRKANGVEAFVLSIQDLGGAGADLIIGSLPGR